MLHSKKPEFVDNLLFSKKLNHSKAYFPDNRPTSESFINSLYAQFLSG